MGDTGFDSLAPEIAVTIRGGFELWQVEQADVETGGAESGAVGAANEVLSVPNDPRLLWLIDAWPMLSAGAQQTMLEFVERELIAVGRAVDSAESAEPD